MVGMRSVLHQHLFRRIAQTRLPPSGVRAEATPPQHQLFPSPAARRPQPDPSDLICRRRPVYQDCSIRGHPDRA